MLLRLGTGDNWWTFSSFSDPLADPFDLFLGVLAMLFLALRPLLYASKIAFWMLTFNSLVAMPAFPHSRGSMVFPFVEQARCQYSGPT